VKRDNNIETPARLLHDNRKTGKILLWSWTSPCPKGRELMTNNPKIQSQQPMNRRSLLKTGMFAGSAVAMASAGLLATTPSVSAQESGRNEPLTRSDIAILRFLAAAELIESDLWNQYAELGGVTDGSQNNYQLALQYLDGDASQYITSNTLDENTRRLS
jgi:hypothetical protein